MLSNRRRSIAESVGIAVAHSFFISMLNPKYRGKNFKWSGLSELCSRQAMSHVGLQGDFGRDLPAMQEQAARRAKYTIKQCLKDSGVETWLPLEEVSQ